MNSRLPLGSSTLKGTPLEPRQISSSTSAFENPMGRTQVLYGQSQARNWISTQAPQSVMRPNMSGPVQMQYHRQPHREEWVERPVSNYQPIDYPPHWQAGPALIPSGSPTSHRGGPSISSAYSSHSLRRMSSDEANLDQYGPTYYGSDLSSSVMSLPSKNHSQRRPSNRDEFDGPSQFLDKPEDGGYEPREDELPRLPISLSAQEQDDILTEVNDRLSQCAFDFVAKYQFPIPIESDKRPVRVASDREWSEWVYLLKRLATKRRIPSRVLYNGQIKQLITILENSLEMRHAAKHQSRPVKDDRNVLQLISSGLQVAKILKDATAMHFLDGLYNQTERKIQHRRAGSSPSAFGTMCIM